MRDQVQNNVLRQTCQLTGAVSNDWVWSE